MTSSNSLEQTLGTYAREMKQIDVRKKY